MNIFATSYDPEQCATFLDDKRVVKMCLETAQLLATAIHVSGGHATYKPTHINHPCSRWTRKTRSNYNWLLSHFRYLLTEYECRYNKVHACSRFIEEFSDGVEIIPDGVLTPFPNCTTYKNMKVVTDAYVRYLQDKWTNDKRRPTWYGQP